jgi:hypothetical protein
MKRKREARHMLRRDRRLAAAGDRHRGVRALREVGKEQMKIRVKGREIDCRFCSAGNEGQPSDADERSTETGPPFGPGG